MSEKTGGVLTYLLATLAIMALMGVIDYLLGSRAEIFNAWTLIAVTANKLLGLGLSHPKSGFLIGQWRMGAAALPVAWALYIVVPAVLAVIVVKIADRVTRR